MDWPLSADSTLTGLALIVPRIFDFNLASLMKLVIIIHNSGVKHGYSSFYHGEPFLTWEVHMNKPARATAGDLPANTGDLFNMDHHVCRAKDQ